MKWQYTHLLILLPSFTLNVSKVEKSLFFPSTREKVSARNPVRQLESGTVPPSRHHIESGIRYLRRLFPDEAALDCHADEREAWDGALVKKRRSPIFFCVAFANLCTFRAFFRCFVHLHNEIASIHWTPERLLYITDVSQLQQRNYNNNKKKNHLQRRRDLSVTKFSSSRRDTLRQNKIARNKELVVKRDQEDAPSKQNVIPASAEGGDDDDQRNTLTSGSSREATKNDHEKEMQCRD